MSLSFFSRLFHTPNRFVLGSLFVVAMLGLSRGFFVLQKGLHHASATSMRSSKLKMSTNSIRSMLSTEFEKLLKSNERSNYQIVDVREPDELQMAKFPGEDIINLPLSQAHTWSNEIMQGKVLTQEKPTVCICHHGVRSLRMANFLVSQAQFDEVYNLEGGIHAYATEVDSSVGIY